MAQEKDKCPNWRHVPCEKIAPYVLARMVYCMPALARKKSEKGMGNNLLSLNVLVLLLRFARKK